MESPLLSPLDVDAPLHVREALSGMGRTEDLAFSPDFTRLAIAEFAENRVLVVDVDKDERLATGRLALTGCVELSSRQFHSPHGLTFLDEKTIIVANREGDTLILPVPPRGSTATHHESSPVQTIRPGWRRPKFTPGSVAVLSDTPSQTEVLVCNNYQNSLSRYLLDRRRDYRVRSSQVLLQKRLDVPDGVAVSPDGRWIAISNHSTYTILIFENSGEMNLTTEPAGILINVECPHGLGFTGDCKTLLVASAAAPFVHVFERKAVVDGSERDDWYGMRGPVASLRVMDEETFLKGRANDEEGGPKGLVVSTQLNLVALTSDFQPLAFFDLQEVLQMARLNRPSLTA